MTATTRLVTASSQCHGSDEQESRDLFAGEYWRLRQVGFLLTGDWGEADELTQDPGQPLPLAGPAGPGRGAAPARHPAGGPLRAGSERGQSGAVGGLRRLLARQRSAVVLRFYLDLRLTVERADGTAIAVPGTPSELTLAADLPEDGGRSRQIMQTATMWFWGWDNWCKQPLPQARVRVTSRFASGRRDPLTSAT